VAVRQRLSVCKLDDRRFCVVTGRREPIPGPFGDGQPLLRALRAAGGATCDSQEQARLGLKGTGSITLRSPTTLVPADEFSEILTGHVLPGTLTRPLPQRIPLATRRRSASASPRARDDSPFVELAKPEGRQAKGRVRCERGNIPRRTRRAEARYGAARPDLPPRRQAIGARACGTLGGSGDPHNGGRRRDLGLRDCLPCAWPNSCFALGRQQASL